MKKKFLIFVIGLLILSLAGCTAVEPGELLLPSSSEPVPASPPESPPTGPAEQTPDESEDGPFAYDRLTPFQKELYQVLESGVITLEEPHYFDAAPSSSAVEQVIRFYELHHMYDNWRPYGFRYFATAKTGPWGVRLYEQFDNYGREDEMIEAFERAAEQWLEELPGKDASDAQKARAIARILCERVAYDDVAAEGSFKNSDPSRLSFSAYGAMVNRLAVCSGYAYALQYLAAQLDLPCITVNGSAAGLEFHTWNMVRIDGTWYHVDATWMDGEDGIDERYFLLSDDEIAADHSNPNWVFWLDIDSPPLFDLPEAPQSWTGARMSP
ncbi:MAG: transglutaminase domain-containing protein [Christensenellales bacterium]|jgi:hypothetical protein